VTTQPPKLDAAGTRLWRAVTGVLDLDEHEVLTLRELCRTADMLDTLQAIVDRDGPLLESSQGARAHPALTELRQQRIVYARLVSALRLPVGITEDRSQRRSGPRGVYPIKAEPAS